MLDLDSLAEGMTGLTAGLGVVFAEAGAVCIESQEHLSGVWMAVIGSEPARQQLFWSPVTEQMLRSYNDDEETTEWGATGVAILLARNVTGHHVLQRMPKRTGCDYWIGDTDDGTVQDKMRLEISGTRRGGRAELRSRVREKLRQTQQSDATALPALVIVVDFSEPAAQVAER